MVLLVNEQTYIDLTEKIVKVSAMLGKFIKMLKSEKLGKGEENRKGE